MRIFFTFFLLLTGHFLTAQDLSFEREVREVDSLVEYNRYEVAEKKADSLLLVLANQPGKREITETKLQLLFLKAKMYEKKEENDRALQILLDMIGPASSGKFYKMACRANILLALIYEKKGHYDLSLEYLNTADKIRIQHHLEELYSSILIRRSLYHRFVTKDIDSADYYARKARVYAEKHNIAYDVAAASGMIGIYEARREKYPEAIASSLTAVRYYIKTNDYDGAALVSANISNYYGKLHNGDSALLYGDSAYIFSAKTSFRTQHVIAKYRFQLFEANHNTDSALFYLKKTYDLRDSVVMEEEAIKIRQITEQYQNDKKEAIIKNKNRQMILVISLLVVIAVAAVLLVRSNRKIRSQNKIISRQVEELMKMLDQKQMLLSELQHRVKNNLQHVISILEIQKESVDFNNIDELIRGNQNRIHSMALLHKKLHVSETVNEVELKRYVTELAELVKDSYDSHKKKVQLHGYLEFLDNVQLQNVNALSTLTQVGSAIGVSGNSALQNLNGLSNVTAIGGDIAIVDNALLTDISGLANINPATIADSLGYGLYIENNPLLSVCHLPNFCAYLVNPALTHPRTITGNAGDCISEQAVQSACMLSLDDADDVVITAFPNPVQDILHISYEKGMTDVSVINMLGQVLVSQTVYSTTARLDLSTLPVGNYMVRVTFENGSKILKIVKQ